MTGEPERPHKHQGSDEHRFVVVDVMLWLITFVMILLAIEYLLLLPLEVLSLRWREGRNPARETRPWQMARQGGI